MPDNLGQMGGNKRSQGYRLDAGGVVAESGPFIGEVMNNIDPTHSGRLQVYIETLVNSISNSNHCCLIHNLYCGLIPEYLALKEFPVHLQFQGE